MCAGIQFLEMSKKKKNWKTLPHTQETQGTAVNYIEELGKLVSTALSEHMERLPSQD